MKLARISTSAIITIYFLSLLGLFALLGVAMLNQQGLLSQPSMVKQLVVAAFLLASFIPLVRLILIREKESGLNRVFLETILDELPVALFCKDIRDDFRFRIWNKKSEQLWGIQRDEIVGKTDYDFFPKEQADWFRHKDLETIKLEQMLVIPEEAVTSPGKPEIIVRTRKVIIYDEAKKPMLLVGISEDITQQKFDQAVIEAQRSQMMNTAKMTALGEMAGGIAHEINNPLAIIEIYANQLENMATYNVLEKEKVIKASTVISNTVERIAKITRGLRSFARDAANDPYVRSSIRKLLDETLDFCQEKFAKHGVELTLEEMPVDLFAECRSVQISQVLLNLLNNAFDAVETTPNPFVKVAAIDDGERILIAVTDSGLGIPQGVRERIMLPFFTTKSVGKGTGLGLSISQGIVQGHHGELYLDTHSTHTRFVIAIPKVQMAK